MIDLHYFPGNASFTPHVILRELGIPYELKLVDRTNNMQKDPGYMKINPAGRIPTLVDGDLVLFETAAISLHLGDQFPNSGLVPAFGTKERAHFYKWLVFLTNTIQSDLLIYNYSDKYTSEADCAPATKLAAAERLMDWFDIIEEHLSDGPYFMGEQFTILDVYLTMLSRWARALPNPPRDLARVGAIGRKVLERASVIEVIEIEGIEGDFLG